jgi:hypothetical protein
MGFAERFRALVPGGKTTLESSRSKFFFSAFFDLKKWLLAIVFGSGGIAAIQFAPHKKEVLA